MTFVITDACIGSKDMSCIAVCPVDCIYELEQMLVIHPGECIDCGACVPECPRDAIAPEVALAEGDQNWVALNAEIAVSASSAQAKLDAYLQAS